MAQKGLTIIQLMFILLISGLVGSYTVDYLIDARCKSQASSDACQNRDASAGASTK